MAGKTVALSLRPPHHKAAGRLAGGRLAAQLSAKLSGRLAGASLHADTTRAGGNQAITARFAPVPDIAFQANALHEIRTSRSMDAAAATGFALALGRLLAGSITACGMKGMQEEAPAIPSPPAADWRIFWISDPLSRVETGDLHLPGMAGFAIAPHHLIRITPSSRRDCLWAAGEVAQSPGISGFCLLEFCGNPPECDLTASRRLMLRASRAKLPVILLRHGARAEPSAAATRWHIAAASGPAAPACGLPSLAARPRFRINLEKCRNARPGPEAGWTLEWNPDEQCLRSAVPSHGHHAIDPGSTMAGEPAIERFA